MKWRPLVQWWLSPEALWGRPPLLPLLTRFPVWHLLPGLIASS